MARITIISSENYAYYKRSKIINLISASCSEEDLFLKGIDIYDKIGIRFHYGKVINVDTNKSQATLEDKSILNYDFLLIASGGSPIILPWEGVNLKGISPLYTLDDAKEVAKKTCDAKNVAIIGGGSIAIKAVKNFIKMGLNVSIIEKSSHLWPIGFDRKISRIFEKEFIDRGVNLYFDDEVIKFNGKNGRVSSITLKSSREIPSDLAIITIGTRPNIDFIKESDIKVDKGILVDEYLRTNIPNIFAAGDVAQTEDPLYQKPVLHPTWGNAKKQGVIAAENMSGNIKKYEGVIPIQTIKGFELQAIAAGITHSKKNFDEISWVSFQNNFCRKYVLDKDNLFGALILGKNINKKQIKPLLKKAVFNQVNISSYKTDLLKENFDLKDLF